MQTFRKFNSIVQFSGIVKHVRDHCSYNNLPLPVLNFSGSTKLHGTNAAIGFSPDNEIWFQSRERILNYESDNAGFCLWGESNRQLLAKIYKEIVDEHQLEHVAMYIFGEWCGHSIQKGVAVSQLKEKKFAIFEIVFVDKDGKDFLIDSVQYHSIVNSYINNAFVVNAVVEPLLVEIDFNQPSLVQNKLLELTLAVEKQCPVGAYFGVTEGCTIGEGIVWTCIDMDLPKFKVKGSEHQSSGIKELKELSAAEIASKANALEFVDYACTENRLNQGIDKLGEMGLSIDIKSMGAFLKWIGQDILKEEIDVLIKSNIDRKDVMPRVSDKSRNWFIKYISEKIDTL